MNEVPAERPIIHCLVALPGILVPDVPRGLCVIDLLHLPTWQRYGWTLVGVDPASEEDWHRWREANPHAG